MTLIFAFSTACQTQKDEASLVEAIEEFNKVFEKGNVDKLSQMLISIPMDLQNLLIKIHV